MKRSKVLFKWHQDCLVRDNFTCVDCGETNSNKVLVHHIDESRKNGFSVMNNNLDNLVTVCYPCHARRHGYTQNREDVSEMRKSGMTFSDIGKKLGVSRQRVYQIYVKDLSDYEIIKHIPKNSKEQKKRPKKEPYREYFSYYDFDLLDKKILHSYESGISVADIAYIYRQNVNFVKDRLYNLGVPKPTRKKIGIV